MLPTDIIKTEMAVGFPDVCKTPVPPAPFTPVPYPETDYEANLRAANKADAAAKNGNKKATAAVNLAIKNAVKATENLDFRSKLGIQRITGTLRIESATQAVMIGRTIHQRYNGGPSRIVRYA